MDPNEAELIRDGVRLSTQEIRHVLRTRQRTTRRPGMSPTLVGALRMDFEHRVVVELLAPVGTSGRFLAAPLEISPKCLRVLWSRFVHIGTACLITLTTNDGEAILVDGVVTRCDHFEGMLHETDITFECPVDPTFFVGMTDADAAHPRTPAGAAAHPALKATPGAPPEPARAGQLGAGSAADDEDEIWLKPGPGFGSGPGVGAKPDPVQETPPVTPAQTPAQTSAQTTAQAPGHAPGHPASNPANIAEGDPSPAPGPPQDETPSGEDGDPARPTGDTMVLAGELFDKLRDGLDAETVRRMLRQIDDSMAS